MITKVKKPLIKQTKLSVWFLKFIAVFRLLLGNYANISKSKPLQFLLKLYCISCCSAVVATFFFEFKIKRNLFSVYFISVVNYTFTAVVYLIYGDKRFLQFFRTIQTNDRIMGFRKFPLISNYVYIIVTVNALVRLGITVYRASFTVRSIKGFCAISFVVNSMDFNNFTIIIIFTILESRIKRLRIFIESNSVPVYITGRNEVAISIKNIRKSLYNYNNLLGSLQCVDKQLQYLLFINWTSHCLRMISLSYSIILTGFDSENPLSHLLSYLIELMQSVVLVSSPAFIVEATTHEVDQIKAILTRQLLRCSDESLRFELETALQYVRLRPFRYTLCRAVPLDIYLPFSVISFCITYVIVALQLTHFSV